MSIKRNYFYNTLNKILKIIIAVITVPYVSRVLGSDNIGIYSYTYTIASYFAIFIMLGLENYGNREIAKVKNNKSLLFNTASEIYYMQLLVGVIVILVYFIYSFSVSGVYSLYIKLQGIYLVSSLIDINWMLSGLEEFKFTSIRNITFNILGFALILIFVRDGDSLLVYTLILSSLAILTNLTCWIYVLRIIRFQKVHIKNVIKHIKPNLVLFIPIIAVSLYKMMDKIMMGSLSSIDQVGLYESAEKIIQIPTVLISSLGTVMLPRMSFLYSDGNYSDAFRYIKKSIYIAMIISTSLCFGIMGVAREFVPLYYGNGFELCADLYLILLPCCIFLSFSNVIRTQFLIPQYKDKVFIISVISGAIINLIVNCICIPSFGAIGAAIGTLVAEISVCTIQSALIKKDLPIKTYILHSIPFVLLGFFMFVILYFTKFNMPVLMQLTIKLVIGFAIYCVGAVMILYFGKSVYGIEFMSMLSHFMKKR